MTTLPPVMTRFSNMVSAFDKSPDGPLVQVESKWHEAPKGVRSTISADELTKMAEYLTANQSELSRVEPEAFNKFHGLVSKVIEHSRPFAEAELNRLEEAGTSVLGRFLFGTNSERHNGSLLSNFLTGDNPFDPAKLPVTNALRTLVWAAGDLQSAHTRYLAGDYLDESPPKIQDGGNPGSPLQIDPPGGKPSSQ